MLKEILSELLSKVEFENRMCVLDPADLKEAKEAIKKDLLEMTSPENIKPIICNKGFGISTAGAEKISEAINEIITRYCGEVL